MRVRRVRILLPQSWHTQRMRRNPFSPMRRPKPRGNTGRSHVRRFALVAAVALIVFMILFSTISAHLRPIISQMASARVNYLASAAINDAITQRLQNGAYTYDHLVTFEKDTTGRITALRTDMMAVNRMKADIIRDVLDAIKDIGTSELGIPFGNLLGNQLFSGRGPMIPVKIVPVGTAAADFSNVFSAAGINQTRHQIVMTLTADISFLMPGQSATTSISVPVNVAETVIVGTVPEAYADFKMG